MKLVKGFVTLILVAAVSMVGTLWAGDMEKIDINKASAKELTQLQKVGQTIAERIVAYRQENGTFKSPEDIMKVKGIGIKTFELNKDRIVAGQLEEKVSDIKKASEGKISVIKKISEEKVSDIKKISEEEVSEVKQVSEAEVESEPKNMPSEKEVKEKKATKRKMSGN